MGHGTGRTNNLHGPKNSIMMDIGRQRHSFRLVCQWGLILGSHMLWWVYAPAMVTRIFLPRKLHGTLQLFGSWSVEHGILPVGVVEFQAFSKVPPDSKKTRPNTIFSLKRPVSHRDGSPGLELPYLPLCSLACTF